MASNNGGSAYLDGNAPIGSTLLLRLLISMLEDFYGRVLDPLNNISGGKIFFKKRAGHSDAGLLIMLNSGVIKNINVQRGRNSYRSTSIRLFEWFHVAVATDLFLRHIWMGR